MNRLLVFLFAIGLATAHGEVPGSGPDGRWLAADRLVEAVRAALPPGWSVSCDKAEGRLTISRDQPVVVLGRSGPNDPFLIPGADPAAETASLRPRQYYFDFGIVPKISPSEYQRVHAANAAFEKQRKALYEKLVKMTPGQRKATYPDENLDGFYPRTKEDMAVMAQYENLNNMGYRLPELYFEDLGLEWGWDSREYTNTGVQDATIRQECERVRAKVIHIFSRYGDDEMKARPVPKQ